MSKGGDLVELARADLRFGRRESNLDDLIILEVSLKLERGDPSRVTRQMQKLWIVRRASQPVVDGGSCSIFADPRGLTAAEIIEQAGLKGLRVRSAVVSDRNANFFEVSSGGTSADVMALIEQIRQQVSEKLGVNLEPDIEMW